MGMGMVMGTGMRMEIKFKEGTGTRVNFLPVPVLVSASPLREMFSSPSSLSHPRLGKNPHPRLFFLDFSWIILCDLCLVKVVLHELVKF